jgi:uncharacterized metal-binding protein
MSKNEGCACNAGPRLIFACSGAADVGTIADQAARTLMRDGVGKMFCLAGVGGRVSGIMKSTGAASAVLAIDGCPLCCAKHCLEEAGFAGFAHLQLEEIGMKKGKTPVTRKKVSKAAEAGAARLADVCQAQALS